MKTRKRDYVLVTRSFARFTGGFQVELPQFQRVLKEKHAMLKWWIRTQDVESTIAAFSTPRAFPRSTKEKPDEKDAEQFAKLWEKAKDQWMRGDSQLNEYKERTTDNMRDHDAVHPQ